MFSIPEQFSSATKSNLEAQFALFSSLTGKAFEGIEKIVELNLTAAKATLEESTAAAKQLLAAKDPQEFFSLTAAQAQPSAEKAIAYGRQALGIAHWVMVVMLADAASLSTLCILDVLVVWKLCACMFLFVWL